MPFKVTARTILQLGGELISSDGIAFYELIKNAFDAGSKKVLVDVVSRVPIETIKTVVADLSDIDEDEDDEEAIHELLETAKKRIREHAVPTATGIKTWLESVEATEDADELMSMMKAANSITFTDYGEGMSLKDLNDIYLTIGTPHRKLQRENSDKVILGEKGIGRLSTMRLGLCLHVETATAKDTCWNVLDIDWEAFNAKVGQLVENIEVDPTKGAQIKAGEERGTKIRITHLNEIWTLPKLTHIANNEIARLLDPFTSSRRIAISLKFNGQRVVVPRMNEILTEKAHAVLDAKFNLIKGEKGVEDVRLSGRIEYLVSGVTEKRLTDRVFSFSHNYDDLCGLFQDKKIDFDIDFDTCVSLGSFTIKSFWFNRRIIKKITVNEEVLDLKAIIRQWSGGLALYRDGFRVPPYGSGDDDWLNLDRAALASQGYKVNRAQLVGKVDISSVQNPALRDQTNREGLRYCPEKHVLVVLCKWVLENEFRTFLKEVDDELRDRTRISFGDLSDQLAEVEGRINDSLDELAETGKENTALGLQRVEKRLRSAYDTVVGVVDEMQSTVEATEDEKGKLLHLAALGLAVEKLAHELSRTTRHALESLQAIEQGGDSKSLREAAEIQLVSLQKRLQNLDPQLGPKRNRKEEFDLRDCLGLAVAAYAGKAQRHHVDIVVDVKPNRPIILRTVKACILQVVHNLLDNSFYWLTAKRRKHDVVENDHQIVITVNASLGTIEVYDNGPGIAPENKERIFREFYTLKKSGEGKGLGLFISRELMELYGGSIELSEMHVNENGRLTTFVVDYSGMRK